MSHMKQVACMMCISMTTITRLVTRPTWQENGSDDSVRTYERSEAAGRPAAGAPESELLTWVSHCPQSVLGAPGPPHR
eukprot:762629-Hanusia_phi.AAC.2